MRKCIQLQAEFLEQHACLAKITTSSLEESKMILKGHAKKNSGMRCYKVKVLPNE